jgi:hypothetical protein
LVFCDSRGGYCGRGPTASRIIPVKEVATFADGATLDLPGRPRACTRPGTVGNAALLLEGRRGC